MTEYCRNLRFWQEFHIPDIRTEKKMDAEYINARKVTL
jgi:hypothetical protein